MLRQHEDYSAKKNTEFPVKQWPCSAVDRLLRKNDATGSADRNGRKHPPARARTLTPLKSLFLKVKKNS